jgi:hypothetical protein
MNDYLSMKKKVTRSKREDTLLQQGWST